MKLLKTHLRTNIYFATILQLLVSLVFFQLTRLFFLLFNQDLFPGIDSGEIFMAFAGGLRFDISATIYLNILFIAMRVIPFRFVYNDVYIKVTNWIYIVCNSLGIIANIIDTPFYRFTNIRTQAIFLSEFAKDGNSFNILLGHLHTFWYLIPVTAVFLFIFIWLALRIRIKVPEKLSFGSKVKDTVTRSGIFICFLVMSIIGIRGHAYNGYPLAISDAMLYTNQNRDVAIVLNTPFSIIRTIGKDNTLEDRNYFSEEDCNKILPVIYNDSISTGKINDKNVVIIILEGIGASFIDSVNVYSDIQKSANKELMPFLNSLSSKSLVFTNAFANGRRSSAGITAVLGGFPALDPFVYMLSPYSHNEVDAIAGLLAGEGYSSQFLCGCNPGSYAFGAMSHAFGFSSFVDRIGYARIMGDNNFDGNWGIYDHAMGQLLLKTINEINKPFIVSWFTISSHGPFKLPDEYKGRYTSPDNSMDQMVEYVDDVLEEFFHNASKTDWFKNTIFVITADHGSLRDNEFYNTPNTLYRIPMLIYTPDGSIKPQKSQTITSQIDIAPTVLGLLGYNKPYITFGSDALDSSRPHYAINLVNGLYQIVEDDYLLQYDVQADKPVALFHQSEDPEMKNNIISEYPQEANKLELRLKAFLQQYSTRIKENRMAYRNNSK